MKSSYDNILLYSYTTGSNNGESEYGWICPLCKDSNVFDKSYYSKIDNEIYCENCWCWIVLFDSSSSDITIDFENFIETNEKLGIIKKATQSLVDENIQILEKRNSLLAFGIEDLLSIETIVYKEDEEENDEENDNKNNNEK